MPSILLSVLRFFSSSGGSAAYNCLCFADLDFSHLLVLTHTHLHGFRKSHMHEGKFSELTALWSLMCSFPLARKCMAVMDILIVSAFFQMLCYHERDVDTRKRDGCRSPAAQGRLCPTLSGAWPSFRGRIPGAVRRNSRGEAVAVVKP